MEITAQLVLSLPKITRIFLYLVLTTSSFVIPFSISQHQLITGTLVNAALIGSVILFPGKLILPLIFFPSLGVLSRGIIFGPLTPFLVYFLPAIWLSNFLLVKVFELSNIRFSYFKSLGISAIAKYLLLYLLANLYFHFSLVPKLFVQTMGIFQLVTALSGGMLVYLLLKGFHGK
jgi:hypothetical protein